MLDQINLGVSDTKFPKAIPALTIKTEELQSAKNLKSLYSAGMEYWSRRIMNNAIIKEELVAMPTAQSSPATTVQEYFRSARNAETESLKEVKTAIVRLDAQQHANILSAITAF